MENNENPIGKMKIDLIFTIDEINEILHSLAHLPFHQAASLIKKIQEQAIPQAEKHEEAFKNAVNAELEQS